MEKQEHKGRACIHITDGVMQYAPIKIEHPKFGEIRWGKMEVKELFDTFQSFLMLPANYQIVGVFYEPLFQMWSVVVESREILLPPPNEEIPTLCPSYEWINDGSPNGKVRMVNINLPERWRYYAGEESHGKTERE